MQIIAEELQANSFLPLKHLPDVLDLDICEKTMRRSIKKRLHYNSRRPARKSQVRNPVDFRVRIAYADQH
ncbi:hypothetical protein TSAR_006295 [Trichomalopsis sarcophagae]|uniref:Uncharacterized protein n=1 Tax=Trichomalopsis sarcophagae TaxID=543379 RepID=A0A232F0Y1_9HYME|nr:hypothetical protein TSAR_006295 [Trichomalopsis sarcophagae]